MENFMLSGFIFSQAFALGFFFTGFTIQYQGSIGSCTMYAVSHCLNLEAGWNATSGSDLWKKGKLGGYAFSDTTGANSNDVVKFSTSITGVVMERISMMFIQSGEKTVLSEGSKQEIRNALASGKKLYLGADLDWRGSTGYTIKRTDTVYSHATCGFNTTTGGIEFVNSWGFWNRNSVGLINWDDLKFGEVWTIDWKTPPEKPKPKWMIIREQQKQKTLQKQSKKIQ